MVVGLGAGGGEPEFHGLRVLLGMTMSWRQKGLRLHNNVKVLKAVERAPLKRAKMVGFLLSVFYHTRCLLNLKVNNIKLYLCSNSLNLLSR